MADLHVVPLDEVGGAVETQAAVQVLVLPAQLVVDQLVRLVEQGNAVAGCARGLAGGAAVRAGFHLAAGDGAVEALGPETLRPGGVPHPVIGLAPAQSDPVDGVIHRGRLELANVGHVVAPAGDIRADHHVGVVGGIAVGQVGHRAVAVLEDGEALETHLEVVPAEAVGQGEVVEEVYRQLAEHGDLLLRPGDVVGELGGRTALAGVIGDHRSLATVELCRVRGVPVGVAVVEVADVLQLHVLVEDAALEADPAGRVGIEAQLVGGALHLVADGGEAGAGVGALDHVRVAGQGRVEGVADAAAPVVAGGVVLAHVAGHIETGVGVVGVVDDLVGFPFQVGAGIEQLQLTQAALEGPGGLGEILGEAVRVVALHFQVAHLGVVVEHAVGVELLLVVGEQQIPAVVDQVLEAGAETLVSGVVEVVLDQGVVAARLVLHRVGAAGLGVAAIGELVPLGVAARRGEDHTVVGGQGRVPVGIRSEGALDVVDVAALAIVEDQHPGGQLVLDQREVEHRAGIGAGVALGHIGRARLEGGGELVDHRFVGDQAHRARLGTRAEDRALGPRQHLDALHVGHIDVQVASTCSDRLLVQVQGHVGGTAVGLLDGGVHGLDGGAANVDFILARPAAAGGHIGQGGDIVGEVGNALFIQGPFGDGRHRHRHALHAGCLLGGGDYHLFQLLALTGGGQAPGEGGDNGAAERVAGGSLAAQAVTGGMLH